MADGLIHSENLNAGTAFPYLVLEVVNEQSYPRNPGFRVMHWHEDLQFLYIQTGSIEVRTLNSSARLMAGEGFFLNKSVAHQILSLDQCHYYSFLFPEHFLSFYPGSPAGKLVAGVAGASGYPSYALAPSIPWQEELLSGLRGLIQLERSKTEFYPYEVLIRLCSLWLIFVKNITSPALEAPSAMEQRMRSFLDYIHSHYGEELRLEDLAASAHVSKSECLRCFRQTMETTPYQYLLEFRLARAAELLRDTDRPVSEIAAEVGFRQLSHFGKCFKEKTGVSPREYRKLGKHCSAGKAVCRRTKSAF